MSAQIAEAVPTQIMSRPPLINRLKAHTPWTLISLAIGAILWEILGHVSKMPFFPPLSKVIETLIALIATGRITTNLLISLVNLVLGFGISMVVGVVIGVAMGRYRKVKAALGVYVYALLTAPSLVFAPIFFSILGDGRASIVAVIFMYSAFIIMINTASAIENVPSSLEEMARSYGANEWKLLTRIIIPAALPGIFTGLRLGMGRAVTGMINGEMFIAIVGLGRVVTQAGNSFDGAAVLAILIVIIIVAISAVSLVQFVDRKLTSWVPSTSKG